jgi:hypothetical protein
VESFSNFSRAVAPYASPGQTRFEGNCVGSKGAKDANRNPLERQRGAARSSELGKKLNPALKSWLDNVIIPALVREYLAEIEKRNRLAATGVSEVRSD